MRFAPTPRGYYPLLMVTFVVVIVISNICATKGVVLFPALSFDVGPLSVHGLVTDGAFWLFPLSYVIGDVVSEVYGYRAMRRIVWTGFGVSIAVAAAFMVTIALPAADFYPNQAALAATVGVVPRILAASLAGFVVGELVNSGVLVAMKKRAGENNMWVRLLSSSVAGQAIDTTVFCTIAAGAIGIDSGAAFLNYVVVGFVWKVMCEALVMPITYQVINYVKRHEPGYFGDSPADGELVGAGHDAG